MRSRKLRIVVGTQLRSRVNFWKADHDNSLGTAYALMLSFEEIVHRGLLEAVSREGLQKYMEFCGDIFLDNGCYAMLRRGRIPPVEPYVQFVKQVKPAWYPVPVDYVPSPSMLCGTARRLAEKTAQMNERFGPDGFVPVIHMGPHFWEFFQRTIRTLRPKRIAIGGMVPYLRFGEGANPREALGMIARARNLFGGRLHVFGLGGGITSLHLSAALGIDSVDSAGWRVRAARGFILLPGRGERMVKRIGGWEGPQVSGEDLATLKNCECVTCCTVGPDALRRRGQQGFESRAVHNVWVLLQEAALINAHRGRRLKSWSLARLRRNRMRYLIEHAFRVAF